VQLMSHINEAKKRLIRSFIISIASFSVIWLYVEEVIQYLLRATNTQVITITPFETLQVQFWLCGYITLLIIFPYIFLESYGFVAPGLYPKEKTAIKLSIPILYISYLLGATIPAYIVIKSTMTVLSRYMLMGVSETVSLASYMSLILMISIVCGIMFCMPAVTGGLTYIRIISSSVLSQYRKHFVIISMIFSAIITPTTDMFCMILLAAPILVLYEVSIIISKIIERNR
jgi:sec-independent protein translocase protein TatC